MKAWLEILRISNLPTVWTNVAAGLAIGWLMTSGQVEISNHLASSIVCTLLAASCLYSGGMVLNDVFDHGIDQSERPGRPIPSGRVRLRTAIQVSAALMIGGIGLAALAGQGNVLPIVVAALIALFAFLYNAVHARTAWSILFLAICRGLLYPLGALVIHPDLPAGFDLTAMIILVLAVIAAVIHTVALSLVARNEVGPRSELDQRYALGTFALAAPGLLALCLMLMLIGTEKSQHVWPSPLTGLLVGVLLLVGWLVRNLQLLKRDPPRVTGFVLGSIAAFPLFDSLFLVMLPGHLAWLGLLGVVVFAIVRMMHRKIPGT